MCVRLCELSTAFFSQINQKVTKDEKIYKISTDQSCFLYYNLNLTRNEVSFGCWIKGLVSRPESIGLQWCRSGLQTVAQNVTCPSTCHTPSRNNQVTMSLTRRGPCSLNTTAHDAPRFHSMVSTGVLYVEGSHGRKKADGLVFSAVEPTRASVSRLSLSLPWGISKL